jgi:hypothetical protein
VREIAITVSCGCAWDEFGTQVATCVRHVSHHSEEAVAELVRQFVGLKRASVFIVNALLTRAITSERKVRTVESRRKRR